MAIVQPDSDAGIHHDGGRWVRLNDLFSVRVVGGSFISRHQPRVEDGERDANAELIAEAFNVCHETGRTPRQLADERAELIVALKEFHPSRIRSRHGELSRAWENARNLLARLTP
jgi:hypothetical protein